MDIFTKLNLKPIRKLNDEGRNSLVYIMHDIQLDAQLVVKCIPKQKFENADKYFDEAVILYSTQHPNIVKIQHATEDDNYIYFSMPHYKKGSIESLINKRYLKVKEIIQYSLDFLNGLHYVHTKGLIHFDIKPTNILINNDNNAVLTDFGLAKYTGDYGLAYPDAMYPYHLVPELLSGSFVSNKSDIFQVGMTLYRLCNGNENFKLQSSKFKNETEFINAIVKGKFPDRKFYLPHIPNKLRKIINKSMNPNPDKRYRTVLDISNDLTSIDKNLNMLYYIDKNNSSECWEYNTSDTHKNRITLIKDTHWKIVCEKIRKLDNKKNFMHNLCSDGYTDRLEGLKKVEELINVINL